MRRRRWFQFSLSGILLLVTALSVWIGAISNRAHKQREAVAAIEFAGGVVGYEYYALPAGHRSPPEPADRPWWRNILGDEYFQSVILADLRKAKLSDDLVSRVGGQATITNLMLTVPDLRNRDLAFLTNLKNLECLNLSFDKLDPAGLDYLEHLPNLKLLVLPDSPVGNSGLQRIGAIKSLQSLTFSDPRVTDAGIEHLTSLRELEDLYIYDAGITDLGIEYLAKLKKLRILTVRSAAPHQITDAAAEHLAGLTELVELYLEGDVTDAGLRRLRGLSKLKDLQIHSHGATERGAEELKQAIPGCFVRVVVEQR